MFCDPPRLPSLKLVFKLMVPLGVLLIRELLPVLMEVADQFSVPVLITCPPLFNDKPLLKDPPLNCTVLGQKDLLPAYR